MSIESNKMNGTKQSTEQGRIKFLLITLKGNEMRFQPKLKDRELK